MAAAAFRPMFAAAREEAAVIASEASMAARNALGTEAKSAAREAEHEILSPVAIREAAEANAKRNIDMAEHHNVFRNFSHAKVRPGTGPCTPTLTTSTTSTSTLLSEASSALAEHNAAHELSQSALRKTNVGHLMESDLGVTVREAMTNGAESGIQDVAEQAAERAKTALNGNLPLDRRFPKAFTNMVPPQA
ncbi:uncharacterized protein CcaverHIS019_0401800 [Cutaneotrichosporon cavernicola]|uniref:SMP domain-containing protein n=1 Tax=Cutaneotrichosporon cavernicola TaxID=279322 RepID=A0AA48L3P0_9TREE|nr:uncharacterized protein CcaverHIS019_0401800 [Cutaneotrichosporon cavernicola]BEI91360.1 hypothetical protein CcaverHIS019_0401800 [Cutaneotrichosporon cavernicola]BEI99133.1 hypothetical protein CcaverHIS631_0401760 [Cutaneotrichosporon cavernicola]BEJ06908.1 hypothetical protein CcaverHIS641_0401770 [Cutaneotrichosporon cavernicola]